MTANELTASIIKYLNYMGFKVWRNNTVGYCNGRYLNATKGVPDIIGYEKKTARFIGVEVKVGKDKLSPEQVYFLQESLEDNCYSIVAKDFDQFLKDLQTLKQKFEDEN